MNEPVTARQFHADPSVAGWRVVGDGACTHFRTGSFARYRPVAPSPGQAPKPRIRCRSHGTGTRTPPKGGARNLHRAAAVRPSFPGRPRHRMTAPARRV